MKKPFIILAIINGLIIIMVCLGTISEGLSSMLFVSGLTSLGLAFVNVIIGVAVSFYNRPIGNAMMIMSAALLLCSATLCTSAAV